MDPPPRLRPHVLVVVTDVPDKIGHLFGATRPVMGDGRDPAERIARYRTLGVHLANDRVLGPSDDERLHRGADAVSAMQHPNRVQDARRIGQMQFGCLREQFDDVVEAAIIDGGRI